MGERLELCRRPESALAHRNAKLAVETGSAKLTVGLLEAALLADFPAFDAEPWDRTGLQVGDPSCEVTKVAVALDATVPAIRQAAQAGANVLVTHHPPYLSAPDAFQPADSVAIANGAGVWEAATRGVALMCFHTALDASPRAAQVLPGMLGLQYEGSVLVPAVSCKGAALPTKGYGQVCSVRMDDVPFTLGQLAARCTAVFGRPPRVWGDFSRELAVVATATGSAGDVVRRALEEGIDCVICGEVKYHDALDAAQAGLALIDLGHDTSELPLVRVLVDAVVRAGVSGESVIVVNQSANWTHPEAVRM